MGFTVHFSWSTVDFKREQVTFLFPKYTSLYVCGHTGLKWVASFMPFHGADEAGGRKRKWEIGGAAYGMP